ncbi:MAG: hypothetical protein ACOVO1_09780 [Chitinophagaceae bacterium]
MKKIAWIPLLALFFASCTKTGVTERYLIFKFKFSDTLPRLNDTGAVVGIASGNAALSPIFNKMSAHYLELAPTATTQLGQGTFWMLGSLKDSAIDFSKSTLAGEGETFFSIPLSAVKPGAYEYLRMSLAYQNFNVGYRMDTVVNGISFNSNYIGTVASFIGYNTYIEDYTINTKTVTVNGKRRQGYWGFESVVGNGGFVFPAVTKTGQAPDSATTVVNTLFATSPVPKGSCVVTASFNQTKYFKDGTFTVFKAPLVITGTEKESITVECNLSTNKSFEWREIVNNGMWDPLKGEQVIDMGIRGMKPVIK